MSNISCKQDYQDLKNKMKQKINSIPTTNVDKKKMQRIRSKNRLLDEQNHQNKIKILRKRREEAIEEGNLKKKYASIAYECDQRGIYAIRKQICSLENEYQVLEKGFSKTDLSILNQFSSLDNPDFWDSLPEDLKYSKKQKGLYYRDVWGISPKKVSKFFKMLELRKKIDKLKSII